MRARLLGAALCWYALSAHAELGINVYGLSYHLDQDKAKELGVDNQVNPGLGVRWRERKTDWDWFADAGFYRDSGRHTAKLAGRGALWHANQRVRLRGALPVLHSQNLQRRQRLTAA